MLPLAQWIMQGRGQALAFVVIAIATSPWLWPNSILVAAAINLAWLRLGSKEGLFLCLWAVLPAIVLIIYKDSFMPLFMVLTAAISSEVLRITRSWPYGLFALSACGLATAVGLEIFAQAPMGIYVDLYSTFLDDLRQQIPDQELNQILLETIDTAFVAGLFGTMLMMAGFISLALARSWQAKLFNPGGFQQEFHQLRLGKIDIVIAVVLTIGFYQMGMQYLTWVWIALFPLLIAGVALFHVVAKSKNLAIQWYILFYCVLAFWDPLKIVLVLATIVDSIVDIRSKLPKRDTDTER
ncbi:MAG: hypothetical protein HRU20_12745 [Pseudomonadales bacterium]|nr:hypothetical protein [Pseudomonadales bacterium]